jgi:3,4-dihydroxy 2-butanone 4-phosphate synthase / GTP cyclohydrolase II
VLTRAGHTEAGCDLARIAGLDPSAVIVEIMNDDGTMARRPDLESFAERHKLKVGTIADLIRYRLRQERSVERIAEQAVETEFGPFRLLAYEDHVHREVHLALVRGSIEATSAPLVRVHPIDTLGDLVGVRDTGRTWSLRDAMKRIAAVGTGIVIVLRDHSTPRELADAVSALGQRLGHPAPAHAAPQVLRTYGIGAQILKDLGLTSIRILTNNPKKIIGLEGYGLSVSEQLPIQVIANPHNEGYLRTKRERMGHAIHHQALPLDEELIHAEQEEDRRRRDDDEPGGA